MPNKILLHLCCGPCGTASYKKIKSDGYDPDFIYYNPNIHPASEYKKRLREVLKLSETSSVLLIEDQYQPAEYFDAVREIADNQPERCRRCWELRLRRVAEKAKELGYTSFGTSLRISPYQDQAKLLEVAQGISAEYGLNFYDYPLEEFYRESVQLSKSLEMYRQKYCGCIYSKNNK